MVDETILDLAGPSAGLGSKPDKKHGAAYIGKYYARDDRTGPINTDGRGKGKQGFGLGITAVSTVGPPDKLHLVPAVIAAIHIHTPTSGSADAVDVCLTHLKRNGLDNRPADGKTWPLLTVDMGYNPKDAFPHVMLKHQYSAVARYPADWTLSEPSANPPGTKESTPPGPIQHAGAFYCPAAQAELLKLTVPRSRALLASGEWEEHDNRLAAALPFLMGTNSLPVVSGLRGRPRLGEEPPTYVKQELVCPAVQLRVRCPLKPDSMTATGFGVPLAQPTWQADERVCCRQSTMRLALTDRQFEKAQWRLVPGSWEHMLAFESARALTEQRFSLLKSAPHHPNQRNEVGTPTRAHDQTDPGPGGRGDEPPNPKNPFRPTRANGVRRHPVEATHPTPRPRTHPDTTQNVSSRGPAPNRRAGNPLPGETRLAGSWDSGRKTFPRDWPLKPKKTSEAASA